MTVAELIEHLSKVKDQQAEVKVTDDYTGPWFDIRTIDAVFDKGNTVIIQAI